jgi:1-deoxy-D-xylulose-5-phosphate synthase
MSVIVSRAIPDVCDGLKPVVAIYSTFLQRAYDQIIHDVALQKLPVIFCIDRAGIVGEDGPTHHGVFDLAYLRVIPNIHIFAPLNAIDLRNMLYTAQLGNLKQPLAIRYPRGNSSVKKWQLPFKEIAIGKGVCLKKGTDLAILSIGTIGLEVMNALSDLDTNTAIKVAHYDMRFVKPLDETLLLKIFKSYKNIITIEDGVLKGGFGSALLEFANKQKIVGNNITCLGIADEFVTQGKISELYKKTGLDKEAIKHAILNNLS